MASMNTIRKGRRIWSLYVNVNLGEGNSLTMSGVLDRSFSRQGEPVGLPASCQLCRPATHADAAGKAEWSP